MTIRPDLTPDSKPLAMSRRQALGLLGGAAATAAVGTQLPGRGSADGGTGPGGRARASAQPEASSARTAAGTNRTLIVVELQGGNDGLATVLPVGDGRFWDFRGQLVAERDQLVSLDDNTALHPALGPLQDRGLAVIQGVGVAQPDGSHFEMERRWWQGVSDSKSGEATGFLGRVCDEVNAGALVTGLALSSNAASPALTSRAATTINLPGNNGLSFLDPSDSWSGSLRGALTSISSAQVSDSGPRDQVRVGVGAALDIADQFGSILDAEHDAETGELIGSSVAYPETDFANRMRMAAAFVSADVGLKVVHVQMSGFDTHGNQPWGHDALLEDLGPALAAFLDDIAERGYGDSTLVATTSEFGRRVMPNESGTDHGTAAPMLLCGPVHTGLHGDAPALNNLDDGNLIATTSMNDYYATLAEWWLGVPAQSVLTGGTPLFA